MSPIKAHIFLSSEFFISVFPFKSISFPHLYTQHNNANTVSMQYFSSFMFSFCIISHLDVFPSHCRIFIVDDPEKNVTSSVENFLIKFQILLLNFLFVSITECLTLKIINLFGQLLPLPYCEPLEVHKVFCNYGKKYSFKNR